MTRTGQRLGSGGGESSAEPFTIRQLCSASELPMQRRCPAAACRWPGPWPIRCGSGGRARTSGSRRYLRRAVPHLRSAGARPVHRCVMTRMSKPALSADRRTTAAARATTGACRTAARRSPPRRRWPAASAPGSALRSARRERNDVIDGQIESTSRRSSVQEAPMPARIPSGTATAIARIAIDGVTRTNTSGVS